MNRRRQTNYGEFGESYVIYVDGSATILGNGTLNVTSKDAEMIYCSTLVTTSDVMSGEANDTDISTDAAIADK